MALRVPPNYNGSACASPLQWLCVCLLITSNYFQLLPITSDDYNSPCSLRNSTEINSAARELRQRVTAQVWGGHGCVSPRIRERECGFEDEFQYEFGEHECGTTRRENAVAVHRAQTEAADDMYVDEPYPILDPNSRRTSYTLMTSE